ncbi:hypothetical protein P4O66_006372 [Electrophorus voltai]|uniref:acylglycerol lipase n=1 Tax=Electrophorus voltai TaxID=2609070 RepID=A0AAD9DY51_9TELE|nr:hypothetical protein P4O66_006372 [Electrophorus voltai]
MLAIPILSFVASFLLWPAVLIKLYHWYWRRRLGLQVDYAECDGFHFCYMHRGKPGSRPSMLMLHGFSAHKDMWLGVLKFVESMQLNKKPFHLVGTSMGGNVAGVYAARYPKDLSSLTLICPAGLKYPEDSTFVKRLRDIEKTKDVHSIPLIPTTPEEMEEMLKLCSFVRFKIPQQVLDVSGASVLADALPGCQVDLLDNCGHSVVMERPRKAAQLIMDFIIRQQNSGSSSTKKLS